LICHCDDGIVVVVRLEGIMAKVVIGVALRDRLGENGARELSEFVERHSEAVRADVVTICSGSMNGATAEMSTRLSEAKTELAVTIADVKVALIDRLAELRVELLRWSFVFWVGQVAAMFAAMAMFAEWLRP
jgi:hypothetical protein